MTIKNRTAGQTALKSLMVLSTLALLAIGASHANASGVNTNTGAMASIPPTSQQDLDWNRIISIAGERQSDPRDAEREKELSRVQEDPDARNRVMPREKPVSYFKSDASAGFLPKR